MVLLKKQVRIVDRKCMANSILNNSIFFVLKEKY